MTTTEFELKPAIQVANQLSIELGILTKAQLDECEFIVDGTLVFMYNTEIGLFKTRQEMVDYLNNEDYLLEAYLNWELYIDYPHSGIKKNSNLLRHSRDFVLSAKKLKDCMDFSRIPKNQNIIEFINKNTQFIS